jgi:hypothetical protein
MSTPLRRPLALAAAVPLLFLHSRYTPGVTLPLGSADVDLRLTDAAIAAVVAAAAVTWRREGPGRLGSARALWIPVGVLVGLVAASVAWGAIATDGYPAAVNAVSAAKFAEYALLAPAAALLLRARADVAAVAVSLTAWTVAAAGVGLLQFVGLVADLDDTPAGRRKPSFVGYHDFAALSGATLLLGVALLALPAASPRVRLLGRVAAAAGAVGLALAGSVAAAAGVLAGATAMLLLLRPAARRLAVTVAVVASAVGGTLLIRSGDVVDFGRFLGADEGEQAGVETYSHRTVLSYIGLRIAADHLLTGTGWQGSALPSSFEPYLDDARARFPTVTEEALPSREHPWGVQNAYVQAAADLGIAGLAALLAVLVAAGLLAYRRAPAPAALVALGCLLVGAAELAALGLVSGVPVWALLWLAAGAAVASPLVDEGDL